MKENRRPGITEPLSPQVFSDILDHLTEGCQIIGANLEVIYSNHCIAERWKLPRERIIGKKIQDLFPGLDKTVLFQPLQKCLKDGLKQHVEADLAFPDGSGGRFLLSFSPVPGGVSILYREVPEQASVDLESELRFQAMDASIDGLAILSSAGIYLYVNPAHAQIYGYDHPDDLLGKSWQVLYESDEMNRFQTRILPELFSQGKWRGEAVGKRRDGSLFPQEVSLTALQGGGLICNVRDISERLRVGESQRESEERFRLLAELAPVGIVISDIHENTLYVSPKFVDMFGYDKVDMPSAAEWWQLAYPDPVLRAVISREWEAVREKAKETGADAPVLEATVTCRDGSVRQIEFRLAASQDLHFIVFTDITNRKQVEEALRRSENRIQSVLRSAPTGIGVVVERKLIHVNQRMCEFSGYSEEELLGQNARMLYPSQEDYDYVGREKYDQIRTRGTGTVETRWRRKDGVVIDVLLSSTPIDLDDLSQGVTFTALDITDRKKAAEALQESEQRFQNFLRVVPDMISIHDPQMNILYSNWQGFAAVPETEQVRYTKCYQTYRGLDTICPDCRAKAVLETGSAFQDEVRLADGTWLDLRVIPLLDENSRVEAFMEWVRDITIQKEAVEEQERLQQQLYQVQKMESVGRLAGGVAHDFNNMLNVILNHAEIALQDVSMDSTLRRDLEEIQNAAQRSADLTRQLLAFARRQTVSPRILDLNATVESMLRMLCRLIGEDIDLVWQPAEKLYPIRMDPAQIDQILANLVVNARDAIGHRVGRITIETGTVEFDEAYCAANQGFLPGVYSELTVSDDGCGMDKLTQAQVFEPFFTTKRVGKGTGLGLATVYGIVKQNEGFIHVYSELGHGTTFRIYLPVHRTSGEEMGNDQAVQVQPATSGQETIMLVEDEPSILALGVRILERLGYRVLPAATPGEAIQQAREHAGPIHLLITDVVMPEMNGRDLEKALLAFFPDLKRLFMSGYTANVIAHQGVLDEGVNFLQKPFSIHDLAEKVRTSLDKE